MGGSANSVRDQFEVLVAERLFDPRSRNGLRSDIDISFFSHVDNLCDEAERTLTWIAAVDLAFARGNSFLIQLLRNELEHAIAATADVNYGKIGPILVAQQQFNKNAGASGFKIHHVEEVIGYTKHGSAAFDVPVAGVREGQETRLGINRVRSDQIYTSVSKTITKWKRVSGVDLSTHPDIAVYLARHELYPGTGALPSPADVQKGRLFPALFRDIHRRVEGGQGKNGKVLELAGTLFLASLPGYIVRHDVQSAGFQIDILARHYVGFGDFRDLHGRDLLCECKDTKKPVGLDPVAKLFALLEANDVQLGILLTKSRLTESGEERNARDLLRRMAARTGRYVMIMMLDELVNLAESNGNTVQFLRNKFYEARSL